MQESIRENLANLTPLVFKHLVEHLLKKMACVELTKRFGDGGVDVVTDIELGITPAREIIQAKHHKRAIQHKKPDALKAPFIVSTHRGEQSSPPLDTRRMLVMPPLNRGSPNHSHRRRKADRFAAMVSAPVRRH